MSLKQLPVWVEPIQLNQWPTRWVESNSLDYGLPLPKRWRLDTTAFQSPVDGSDLYRGEFASELLAVHLMRQASPAYDLGTWVEAVLQMTGFPSPILAAAGGAETQLLDWQAWGDAAALNQRLAVDETRLYMGLAMLGKKAPELARFYIVLARRRTLAWQVMVSFMSACLPGTAEEMVIANDHVRAGAILGGLRFLGGG